MIMQRIGGRLGLVGMLLGGAYAGGGDLPAEALAALREERTQMARRPRRLIFNNDGDDQGQAREATVEGFLAVRTTPLADSQVDTICYSTFRGGFPLFSHRTEVGETLRITPWHRERYAARGHVSVLPTFLEAGTDPLQEMIHWCREHGREIFWSLRMNDTHDTAWPEEHFPEFKKQRPDLLLGARGRHLPHGAWSALDYSLPEVRELFFRVIEEVCRNYDIDGVELDFFRMLHYFPVVARGGAAGDEERAMMTGLLRRIRRMTEEEGLRRGRPILLAARTPDSVAYCRAIGLALEAWLEEGLLDIYVAGGDFRLNTWDYSVSLARRHGVAVWADIDPAIGYSGYGGANRNAIETLRGRALEAWSAGVDGVYLFNHFSPRHPMWRELGDPEGLARRTRHYFVNVMGLSGFLRPELYLHRGERFRNLPAVHPDTPLVLAPGEEREVRHWIDLPPGGASPDASWSVRGHLAVPKADMDAFSLRVLLNGHEISLGRPSDGGVLPFDLPVEYLVDGWNRWALALDGAAPEEAWDMRYRADKLLRMPDQLPWRRLPPHGASGYVEEIRDGALLLADRGTGEQDLHNLVYPWPVEPGEEVVVEVRLKVLGAPDPRAVCLRLADGKRTEFINFYDGRIELERHGLSYRIDTTSDFRTYRITFGGGRDLVIEADGREALRLAGGLQGDIQDPSLRVPLGYGMDHFNDRSLYIGSATGPGRGEALWELIRYRTASVTLTDILVRLETKSAEPAE